MKKEPKFTPEEAKLFGQAASAVWDYVACDCLAAIAEEKGKDVNSITIRRSLVIEIALDAGRPEEELRKMRRSAEKHRPEEVPVIDSLLKKLSFSTRPSNITYKDLIKAVTPAFPFTHYGM